MVKPSDIARHLSTYISMFTDLFSNSVNITSAFITANNTINVNAVNHGLINNQAVVVPTGQVRNTITNVTISGEETTITTQYDHTLITPKYLNDPKTVQFYNFLPSSWNVEHELIRVTGKKTFVVKTINELVPTTNGNIAENRNILGFRNITVVDANNFTYQVPETQPLPEEIIDNMKVISGYRIYVVASVERANEIYTRLNSNELALVVLMGDVEVSRDRNTESDMIAGFTEQNFQLLKLITNFQTLVYIPIDNDLGATEALELVYGSVYTDLIAIFQGFGFDQTNGIKYVTVTNGHGREDLNPAYYLHVYDWQAPSAINIQDGYSQKIGPVTEVFRQISMSFNVNSDPAAQMTANLILN